jgi:hypothetical protein
MIQYNSTLDSKGEVAMNFLLQTSASSSWTNYGGPRPQLQLSVKRSPRHFSVMGREELHKLGFCRGFASPPWNQRLY